MGRRTHTNTAPNAHKHLHAEKHRHAQKERKMKRDRLTRKYQYTRPSASRTTKMLYIYDVERIKTDDDFDTIFLNVQDLLHNPQSQHTNT